MHFLAIHLQLLCSLLEFTPINALPRISSAAAVLAPIIYFWRIPFPLSHVQPT